jgi:YD repeat-containing protein
MVVMPKVDDPQDVPDQGMVHPLYRYIYDIYGNQVGILDPKGRLTALEYNAFNQLTKRYMPFVVANPSAIVDAEDVRQAVAAQTTTPDSETTTYDSHGRVEQRVDYEGHTTVYRYYVNDTTSVDHFLNVTTSTFIGIPGQLRVEENRVLSASLKNL